MRSKRLSRRAMLRGAGGIAIGLPFLEVMGTPRRARGALGDVPKRLVVVYSPHGRPDASNDKWRPTGTGTNFQLGEFMADLAPHQEQMVVVSGLNLESARNQSGNGHSKGPTHALTCTPHQSQALPGDNSMGQIGYAGGISMDQTVANEIAQTTPLKFHSLQFGVQSGADFAVNGATTRSYIAYSGPGEPLPAEDNPGAMFDRLFADFTGGDAAELERIRAQRRSVLDFVIEDFEKLNPSLGSDDRGRLDKHLETIREVERSIDLGPGTLSGACEIPDIGVPVEAYKENDNFPEVGRQQTELLAMALACDMTRVATFQWSTGQSTTRHAWVPGAGGKSHHGLTHDGSAARDAYEGIVTWYAGRVADLVATLASIPESDGTTLLDNTAVLWIAGEMAKADAHNFNDMPYVLFGGACGAIRTGQHIDVAGRATNDLHLSLLQAMDVDTTTFGDPQWVQGPLPGLLA